MNNLIDLINQWANRLVIRILMLSGTPKEQTDRVLKAMEDRNSALNDADSKIKGKVKWVKYLMISLIVIFGIIIVLKIKKLRK